eukprot:COSAG06_NODE_42309_length_383_cov_0.545775_2_plen_64_part_01
MGNNFAYIRCSRKEAPVQRAVYGFAALGLSQADCGNLGACSRCCDAATAALRGVVLCGVLVQCW